MAKTNQAKRARQRNIYRQKLQEWRRTNPGHGEPIRELLTAPSKRNVYQATHPLLIWPKVGQVEPYDGVLGIQIPKVFSFIEDPIAALEVLYRLRAALGDRAVKEIYLNHKECEVLDLCASVVSDVLVLRGKQERKVHGSTIGISGKFSDNPEVNVLLKASGILKHLGLAAAALPEEVKNRLELCPLHQGTPSPPMRTSEGEMAATKLTSFFDRCLSTERYRLKARWQSDLISLITEVLDNCEQHAHLDRYWYTIGHFNRLPTGSGGECHIVVFNFGDSIFDSLNRPDTSDALKQRIRALAALHRAKGLFAQFRKNKWEEESLWTLYALQEGISRFSGSPGGEDRGNGTVRMIEFFRRLAGENPKMALISGKTYILFDGKYSLRDEETEDGEKRKVIAFNDANDLTEAPNEAYVRTLPRAFPGTLVSLRFLLHKEHLKSVREVVDEHTGSDD